MYTYVLCIPINVYLSYCKDVIPNCFPSYFPDFFYHETDKHRMISCPFQPSLWFLKHSGDQDVVYYGKQDSPDFKATHIYYFNKRLYRRLGNKHLFQLRLLREQ